jgi:hypothetical protein
MLERVIVMLGNARRHPSRARLTILVTPFW